MLMVRDFVESLRLLRLQCFRENITYRKKFERPLESTFKQRERFCRIILVYLKLTVRVPFAVNVSFINYSSKLLMQLVERIAFEGLGNVSVFGPPFLL